MTPDEIAYQDELRRGGLAIPLNVHEAFRPSLNGLLGLIEGSSEPIAAQFVRLGRFTTDQGDVLLVPNDTDSVRRIWTAARLISGDSSVDMMLRVRAQDLMRLIEKAAPAVAQTPAGATGASCLRSPCSDPKTTEAEVQAADVGASKARRRLTLVRRKTGRFYPREHKRAGEEIIETLPRFTPTDDMNRPGDNDWPLTVALGLGVDSVAIIVGLVQLWRETGDRRWVPDAITFADVGSEKQATYDYLGLLDDFLARSGFPRVTVVATAQGFVRPKWGSYRTLEQKCLINHTLPKIAFGFRRAECSITWKHVPQHEFFREKYDLSAFGGRGPRIIRAVGYDVDETERACGKGGQSTYRTHEEAEKAGGAYEFWYPLMEWGWTRARCIAEIRSELGREPEKSSCTMCPAMKAWEVLELDTEDLERAIFMEQVAKLGRRPLTQAGLNPAWSWTALATADESELPSRGKVLELSRRVGPVVSRERLAELIRLAKQWVAKSPRTPYSRDMSEHPLTEEIPAFFRIKGFRDTERMDMDKADTEAEEAGE